MDDKWSIKAKKWRSLAQEDYSKKMPSLTIKGVCNLLKQNIGDGDGDGRPTIGLGHGDPGLFPCFRISPAAEEAVIDALRSQKFNCYAPTGGIFPARRAIAGYLSHDLPYELSPDDVYVTCGCKQSIQVALAALARGRCANILLPRPGYPRYESNCSFNSIAARHYDLLPDKSWEVDLSSVEALADESTAAIVIINPGNPCGNVYSSQHLKQIAETARKLGIVVIADEVYGHLCFGDKPFVPMGVFGSIVPVITLGSISKRWGVPGWRLGWIVKSDPNQMLLETGISEAIKRCLEFSAEPATFIQGAIPRILENTTDETFLEHLNILREASDKCYNKLKDIKCISCPQKPEGSMFLMAKLDFSFLEDITSDMDFCLKLAKEEHVIILPGSTVGLMNWLRITFAVDPICLEDGLERLRAFCIRHSPESTS